MTLAADFDGVIHGYSRGWHDGTIYDPPLPGAVEGMQALMRHDAVFVHTTREPEPVVAWLVSYGFDATADDRCPTCRGAGGGQEVDADLRPTGPAWTCGDCKGSGLLTFWNKRGRLLVTNRKLPAVAYLDDRAVRFHDWTSALTAMGVNHRLLDCGLCYEEWGEEVHPHPECPMGRPPVLLGQEGEQLPELVTQPKSYTLTLLPEDHPHWALFAIHVERQLGTDQWGIRIGGQALDANGLWGHDAPCRCRRNHARRRFPLDEALARARTAVLEVKVGDRTAIDVYRQTLEQQR